jgi:hypothetical protein
MTKIRTILLCMGLLLPVCAAWGDALPKVVQVSPRGWSDSATTGSVVEAELDAVLSGSTNFVLHSSWRGARAGTVTGGGLQNSFTPAAPLLPGESFESVLSGEAGTAFSWRFQSAPQGGGASFVTSSITTLIELPGVARFRNIALADVNGDGAIDVVAPAWGSNKVFFASPSPAFSSNAVLGRAIQDVAVGDFNSDGLPDLVLGCATQAFAVALNSAGGLVAGSVQTVSGVTGPLRSVAVSDLDGNGKPDAVAVSETSGHVIPLLNNGAGALTSGVAIACGSALYALDVGDLDRDGIPDVVAVGLAGRLFILKGKGGGSFEAPAEHLVSDQSLYACRIADFNQDGYADIAAVGAGGVVVVGTGSSTNIVFAGIDHGLALSTLYGLAVADCDANGYPDLVVCGGTSVAVLLGVNGSFTPKSPTVELPGELLRDVEIGDLNQDGCLDLVVCGLSSGKTYVLWNAPAPVPLIKGNGLEITSGEAASLEKGTDFGVVPVYTTRTNQFQFINRGKGTLLVTETNLSGVSASIMKVLNMPVSVSPGATQLFSVVYSPESTGTVAAVLTITNNSLATVTNAASPYVIHLAGQSVRSSPRLLAIAGTNAVYDGTAKPVVVTVDPVTNFTVLYDGLSEAPVTAGVYAVIAEVNTALCYGTVTSVLTIAKRPLTVTCPDARRGYGETNPVVSVTLTNFVAGEGLTNLISAPVAACLATTNSPVGTYPISGTNGLAENYSFANVSGTLTVTQALLIVKADNKSRLMGESDPAFTATFTGWKNGEGTNVFATQPVGTSTATLASPSGTYPITFSGGAATNYSFYYLGGTLTVYGVTAQVAITNTGFTYDGTPKSVTVTTFPTNLDVQVTYNGVETAPVTAGVYAVFAQILGSDYSGSTNGTLTIRKASQTVTTFLPANGAYPADWLLSLSASGSPSGIPVSFAVASGPACMASTNQLRFLGSGAVTVSAWQPEGDNWLASPAVTNQYSATETNAVHFAALAGQTPLWPYASWATAASNIQVAVDEASSGETVRVGSGQYTTGGRPAPGAALSNRLVIGKGIRVLAEYGPSATFLVGQPGTGAAAPLGSNAVRCAFVTQGALLAGFTLTNGFTAGESAAASDQAGGGALLSSGGLLSNCVMVACGAVSGGGFHGGAATRCVLSGNQALAEGGGAAEAALTACLLWNNAAPYGGGAFQCELNACTLADNTALFGGGTYEGSLVNGIVWYNTGYDCFGTVASRVNAGSGVTAGLDGCLVAPPLFVNRAQGDYRLAYGSPCINAGTNSASPAGALDLEGAVRPIHATVDMGAYEFFGTPGVPVLSALSGVRAHQVDVAWLASTDSVRVIGFRIAVSNQADAAGSIETVVPAPALSGVVTGLAPNTVYSCRIRQENEYDAGAWTGWQCFTTLTEAAMITVTTRTFNVTYAAGHTFTQSVALANAGATPCVWSGAVSYEGTAKDWLSVAPVGGTVGAFDSTGVLFVVNASGLRVGTYTANHTLTSPNATNSPLVQVVTLTVTRAVDTITFEATNQVYGGTSRVVTATAGSGEAVAVTYNGSSTPPVDAGVYAVSGVVDTVDWTASSSTWLTVSRAPQAITAFLPASGDVPSTNAMSLTASEGGSGNPLVFTLVSGPARLLPGNQVRFSDYGEVRVSVEQAGNSNWLPAPTVTNVYRVVPVAALLHHVARAGQSPLWPYASWGSAASNIQDAVDAAWDGDAVAVTSGVYQAGGRVAPGGAITNRICVTRAIELYGVRGAASTVVVGAPGTDSGLDAVRGLFAGTNAVIRGFTFAGGRTASTGGLAQDRSGGGVYLAGGAELRHCIVSNNSSAIYGGGAFVQQTGRVNNCLLTGNTSARGGGLCLYAGGEALHCTIASNEATTAAGGAYLPNGGTIGHGIVWGNRAPAGSPQNLQSMSASIVYTCAGDGVTAGVAGCLVADPMFAPDGFMLESESPCVNVGDNAQAATTTDLKGDPRIVSTLDLGAYEYVVTAAAPKGLEISDLTGSSVNLHWRPGDNMPVTTYNVEMETLEGSNVLSAQFPGTTTSTVAVGLSDSMPYRWRAQASNSQGVSLWTSWKSFITRGIILTVTPASCNVGGGLEVLVEGRGLSLTSDIHAVSLAGVPASILGQGTNWVRVLAPAAPTPGTGDVAVSSVSGGDLLLSNAFVFLPAAAPVMLPPSNLSETSLVARWEALPGAVSYRFQASAVSNFASFLPGYEGTNALVDLTQLDVFPLVPGTNYLRMQAWFAEGFGPFSTTQTVKRRLQSLTISETNAVYDGTGKSVSVAVEPVSLASSVAVLYNGSATLPVTAGVYAVAAEVNTESYFGQQTGVLSIARRDLIATGDNTSRAYGAANPALSYTWFNFAAGEGVSNLVERPVVACSATNNSPVGDYSIEVSGGSSANYRVVCSNGTLTVTQAVLTVTADDATWLYGKTNAPFSLTITGWKNGDGTNALTVQPRAASVATPLSLSGPYPITVSGGSALNYAFTYVSGTLTLNPIEAGVTITGTNLVYDGNPKSATATTDPTNLVVVLTYNGLETEPVTAGVYAVHAEIDEQNYCGSTNATLTIRKADQAVASFRPASGTYPADQLLALSADGSPSGIPVTFTVLSGPGVLETGHGLRFQGFGSVKLVAGQAGDANWNASPAVTNTYEAVETNTVYFVAKAGQTPRWPYISPETAASNIQTAVDQASSGETVWVGPGLYAEGGRPAAGAALTNRLVLDKAVSVLSVAGPAATVIAGRPGTGGEAPLGPDAIRCVVMTDGALLAGFTLTNGFTAGALAGLSEQAGGGAYLASSAMISNCVITGCGAVSGGGLQGGIALRCRLTGNAAINEGGGAANARLSACLLWNNAAPYGGGAFRCDLASCTLADNTALYGGGTYEGGLVNGVAWYNTGWDCFGTQVAFVDAGSGIAAGVNGCLSLEPLFVNRAQGDYRLAYGSPCINSGTNGASPAGALDLDGAARPIHATVDMGAFEFYGTPGLPLLAAPADIRAHQAAMSWQASTDSVRVIGFRIAVSNQAAAAPAIETVVQAPALSGVVTGLAPNTAYACRVRAENDYDVGAWTGWQCFTTLTEAVIMADPALTFNATYASGLSSTQVVSLANPGASPCVWSGAVSYPGASAGWLGVAPGGGTVEASGSTGLAFVVSARGLDAGTHTAWHTLSSPNATNSPQVQVVTLQVARATDTITFGATNQVFSGSARPVTAASFSGQPVKVTYNGLADAPVAAGSYSVTGVVDTLNWTAVSTTRLTIARAPQAITGFLPASGDVTSTNILALAANGGGSGKALVFAVVSGPASLLPGNRVRFSGYGDVRVTAGQAGNVNWLAAPTVTNLYRVIPVPGLTHFVAMAGQAPLWPYASWDSAASNIQDAVDVAWDGDFVTVSNGDYRAGGRPAPGGTITNRICITRAITLASVNGPAVTRVFGAEPATGSGFDAVRGLYAATGAVVRGFTFTGGHSAFVSDLSQDRSGGGVYLTGGAELSHCIVTGNRSAEYGGGVFVRESGLVNNCLMTGNQSDQGAGLCLFAGGEAVHCTMASNTAATAAGGVYIPDAGSLVNCIAWGNRAPPAARQDLVSLGGVVTFTCAGDGVADGAAGCRLADPLFAPGGYRPGAASPCVNAGNSARVLAETDLKGDPRVVETVDLGAYEYLASPAVPTNLAVSALTPAGVTLSWHHGDVMPVTGYDVEMETLGTTNVLSWNVPGTEESLAVGGFAEGTGYRWRARAFNSQGTSDWTAWQLFFTPGFIVSVDPVSCNIGGGVDVLIEGQGLGYASNIVSVSLCGVPAAIVDQAEDWVRVTAPMALVSGVGDIRVSSPTGGDSVLSNAFTFLPASAPVLLPPTEITASSLVAHWKALASAQSFQLQVSARADFATLLPGLEGTNAAADALQLDVQGLVAGTNYLRLRARFTNGYGPFCAPFVVPSGAEQPWVRNLMADDAATAGQTRTYDLSAVFAGTGLVLSASCAQPGMAAPRMDGNTLTLMAGPAEGLARIIVTATQADSGYSVSTAFRLEVAPAPLGALRINCGGKKTGLWTRDRGFSGGVVFATNAVVENTSEAFPLAVYQACRGASNLTYSFPDVPNGAYIVRLAFAELVQDRIGARVFKVKIEGKTVLPLLDVFAVTGNKFRAYQPMFKVAVIDGNGMQIKGIGLNGSEAFFNGIKIMPAPPAGMLVVPAGVNTGTDPDAGPYSVTNQGKLFVDDTEVTKQLWDEVRAWGLAHGYTDLAEGAGKAPDHPVQGVSWYDCVKWCNARSQMQGLTPAYYTTSAKEGVYTSGELDLTAECVDAWAGYRLPTGAEWEFAARGGASGLRFPWGNEIDHSFANYFSDAAVAYDAGPTRGLHPDANVGVAPYTLPAKAFGGYGYKAGLYNMAGNVAEWCWDSSEGTNRLVRGGAWSSDASWSRVSQGLMSDAALCADDVGFRAVMPRP